MLALGLALAGSRGPGSLGFEGFSRTSASLLNVCLLLAPLVGVLAQPLARWDILAGMYAGLLAAIALATGIGFGAAGVVIALFSPVIDPTRYLMLLALVVGLAGVMLGLGLLISVAAVSQMRALSVAMAVWFVLVLLFDLGLLGVTLTGALGGRGQVVALLFNPVDVTRVLAVLRLEPDMDVLGPAGAYLSDTLGLAGASALLLGVLARWLMAPLGGAMLLFRRQDA